MRYQYRIYHSEEGKSLFHQISHPLSAEDVLREYYLLPSSLDHLFDDPSIDASCAPASPETSGVIVTLATERSAAEADSLLGRFLVDLNSRIPGLSLVVEKI